MAINNRNEEEDSSEDEELVIPGAFAVGDREERRQKGRLTSTMNLAGGVDMHMEEKSSATVGLEMKMSVYMEEEMSAKGAPSELQAEPDDKTDSNERTFWFTKREKLLALGCFLLVVLPLALGLGLALTKPESPTSPPLTFQDELKLKLANFSLDGDSVFDDLISPQNLAIEWLAEKILWQVEGRTKSMENRYGLAVLYYSTQGDTWQETYNFLEDSDECTWNNVDEEQDRINWKGVICNEQDQVTEILLGMYLLFL
jgi:hypothetical protein